MKYETIRDAKMEGKLNACKIPISLSSSVNPFSIKRNRSKKNSCLNLRGLLSLIKVGRGVSFVVEIRLRLIVSQTKIQLIFVLRLI